MHWMHMRFQRPPLPLPAQWRDQLTPCSRCHLLPNFLLLRLLHMQIPEIDSDSIYPPSPSSYTPPSCTVPPIPRSPTPPSDICASSASTISVVSFPIQTPSQPIFLTSDSPVGFWLPLYSLIRILPPVDANWPGMYPGLPGIRRVRIGASS